MTSCWLTALVLTACSSRSRSDSARRRNASDASTSASAWFLAAMYGSRSITNSRSPFLTNVEGSKLKLSRKPWTRARISTDSMACMLPVKFWNTVTSRWVGVATTTSGGGGGGISGGLQLSRIATSGPYRGDEDDRTQPSHPVPP